MHRLELVARCVITIALSKQAQWNKKLYKGKRTDTIYLSLSYRRLFLNLSLSLWRGQRAPQTDIFTEKHQILELYMYIWSLCPKCFF